MNTPIHIMNKIAFAPGPPNYPPRLSPALKDFLDCCFMIEPINRSNVYELLRHPFLTREEFKAPLANPNRMQTINEQTSDISGASPFSQYQYGFFN